MNSYVTWAAQQIARQSSVWVASHPGESALVGAGLANAATRGIVWDVLKSLVWRQTQMTGRVMLDVGMSLYNRTRWAPKVVSWFRSVGRIAGANPVTTTGVVLTAIAIGYAETSDAMDHGFASPHSSGIGMPLSTTIGGFDEFWGFDR